MVQFQSEKGQKSSIKMVPCQKMVKIPLQKWHHFRQKRVKIPQQNVTFQKRIKNPQQKFYRFRKGSKILDKKWYHFSQKRFKIPRQKMYHFGKGSKLLSKNGTISEEGQTSSTKMVPFQKRVENRQRKWYHFSQKRVKISQRKWYNFRKWSKILDKNGTISEKGQISSTKMVPC